MSAASPEKGVGESRSRSKTARDGHNITSIMVRWNESTHGADLRARVARSEVRIDDLSPNTLYNLTVAHYPETIPEGQFARNTVVQRMRRILLRIRAELDQQGGRRRAAGEGNLLLFSQLNLVVCHISCISFVLPRNFLHMMLQLTTTTKMTTMTTTTNLKA